MKTAFEFLKYFTEDLRIYPDGTSEKDILRMRNAILKAMENFAKQEVNEALASKATAILPHVRCFKTYGENIIKELGFEIDHKYDHDQFHTNRYRKGLLIVEFTYEDKKLQTVDLTIDETFCKPITYAELKALSPILGKIPE